MSAMMKIIIPIPTNPYPQFPSSLFSYKITENVISKSIKHVDKFALKYTPMDKNNVLLTALSKEEVSSDDVSYSASDVVRRFYEGINLRKLEIVVGLITEDCIYEDLVFPKPIVGRKALLFFEKFIYTISEDLQFVIDDKSGEDTSAVGVTWHLSYGRDVVEPAVKPGDFALVAIRGVTWLLQQFPQLADRF